MLAHKIGIDPSPWIKEWGLNFQTVSASFKNLFQLYFGTGLRELLLEVFSFVFR